MSTPPPGQLSPDGMWRSDGRRWVPAAQAPARTTPPGRQTWLWWLAGGCAVLLVLGVAGGIYGIVSLIRAAQSGSFLCLPSDLPQYPGARITHEYTSLGATGHAGDTHECEETFDSNDDVATVHDFYSSHLNAGDWHVASDNPQNGTIDFARVSRPQTVGSVLLLGRGQHTTIAVKLYY